MATLIAGRFADGSNEALISADNIYVSSTAHADSSPGNPASNGKLTSGSARIRLSAAGSCLCKFVVYANSSGAPGALLATSDELTITNTTEQQINFFFSGGQQINIVSGTTYWIGVANDDPGTPEFRISTHTTANGRTRISITYPTLPNPFGSGTLGNGPIDAFISYQEPAGPRRSSITNNRRTRYMATR